MSEQRTVKRGLAFKLSLSILSATILLISGLLFYNYHFSKRLLLESARETAEQLTYSTIHRMESVLVSAQRVPEGLSLFLERPEINEYGMKEMLNFVLQNKPEIFGSAIAFAPYSFNSGIRGYAPYCYRTKDDVQFKDLAEDNYDYFEWDWYILARDREGPVWTEPYFDLGGGNTLMATYAIPFYGNEGNKRIFRGVATADLSLIWLEEMMDSIKVFETGYAYLVSEKGTIITHPVRSFQMRNLNELAGNGNNQELIKIAGQMMQKKEGYLPFQSMIDQRPCWMFYSTLKQTNWHMAVVFPEDELFAGLQNLYLFSYILGVLGILLLSVIVILFSSRITRPLRALTMTADKIGEGNFDVQVNESRSSKEIYMLGKALSTMQLELKEYISNLQNTTAAKERFESELNIAHEIQQGMLPKIFPEREDIDIHALLMPARQVGGDFYDFFFLDEENLCFAIGDVSDKGVPASLMMAMTITLFRAKADINQEISEIVSSINHGICRENESLMFVTFFMGILNVRNGEMKFCNAGHNYPLLLKKNGLTEILSETHGVPLGIDGQHVFNSGKINLDKNEILVLYTDGITEALSVEGDFYGDDRLLELVTNGCKGFKTGQVTKAIMEDVAGFTRNPERSDDITLLVISYYPGNQA
jgi:phosphoserine phosphatase RsbU/P